MTKKLFFYTNVTQIECVNVLHEHTKTKFFTANADTRFDGL